MDSANSAANMNLASEGASKLHPASAAEGDVTSHAGDTASLVSALILPPEDSPTIAENGDLHLVDSWTWSSDARTTIDAVEDAVTHGLLDPIPTIDEQFPRHETSVQEYTLPLVAAPPITSIALSLEVEAGDTQSCTTEADPHMPALSDPAWGPEEMLRGMGQGCSIDEAEILCNQMNEARRERDRETQFLLWLGQSAEQRDKNDNDGVCGSGKR
ncbi:uncharacterized protein DNG_07127 [Cephalotrichum gorgonifer]|uniref:Uncharacterized protein n=1 Tax=Cephalotrichum gorgonifer TaxID=2041049 RepID=A0AAE8SXX5_9PEZI|nr:uncharacterized protein DNG_07127 [Cephalotrichum gorgonifer]